MKQQKIMVIWRHLRSLVASLSFTYGHSEMGVTVERRHRSAARLPVHPARHEDKLPLAASLLNGYPLFKPPWSECVSQPAVSLPPAASEATGMTSAGMRSDRPPGKTGPNWRIGIKDGLFVLSEQIKMFIFPCPNLLGLFLKRKGNKIEFVIRALPWLCLASADTLIG